MYLTKKGMTPIAEMKAKGFKVTEDQLIKMSKGQILHYNDFCSATFLSDQGLFGTNHHCAVGGCMATLRNKIGAQQQAALLQNGYIASSQETELECPDDFVSILTNITNVSASLLKIENDSNLSVTEKNFKLREEKARIVMDCGKISFIKKCELAEMDNEKAPYYLYEFDLVTDVRLVWIPPQSIGNFGGDTDNWEYPRYTGDFTFFRAYGRDGKPYRANYARVSKQPLRDNDPVFIMGFPGETQRNITSDHAQFLQNVETTWRHDLYQALIPIIQQSPKKQFYNESLATLLNFSKKYRIQEDLLIKQKTVATKRAQEQTALAKLQGEALEKVKEAFQTVRRLIERKYVEDPISFMAGHIVYDQTSKSIYFTNLDEIQFTDDKKDIIAYMKEQFDPETEAKILGLYLRYADSWTLRPAIVESMKNEVSELIQSCYENPNEELLRELCAHERSNIHTQMARYMLKKSKMNAEHFAELTWREFEESPLKQFAVEVEALRRQLSSRLSMRDDSFLMSQSKRILSIFSGNKTPDANGTMRITYGNVKGNYKSLYRNQTYPYTTVVSGLLKRDGFVSDPNHIDFPFFQLPEEMKALQNSSSIEQSRFYDPTLKDVPIDFISDLVITGGNSGSGVFNGNGEFIGFAFDGNPESILSDIDFHPEQRTIATDIRYIGFLGETVYPEARYIVQELGMLE
jgi:hypothetical protein